MKRIRSLPLAVLLCLSSAPLSVAQVTIATWTFETSRPASSDSQTIGGIAPEIGSGIGSGFHASAATDWTNPLGNGSSESISSNNWSIDDYYQFQVSTTGLTGISVSWDQQRSSTGPQLFDFYFSTDNATFTNVSNRYSVGTDWSSFNQSLISFSAADNAPNLYLRLTAASAASGGGGTNRVDNFSVTAVPEPSTYALLAGVGALGFAVWRRKRHRATLTTSA